MATDIHCSDGLPLVEVVQSEFAGKRHILEKIRRDQNVELVNTQYTSYRTARYDKRYSKEER